MSTPLPDPGALPRLEWLPVTALVIDRTYQREMDHGHVQSILKAFCWRFFQAITVTDNGDGTYNVVDGQHRCGAARNHPDIDHVPCIVIADQTIDEQAQSFIVMNRSQRRITPVQMYWAAVAAGDPDYVALESLFSRCGVTVYEHSGYGVLPPRTTAAVNTVLKLVRRHGEETVETTLKAIVTAWPEEKTTLTSRIIEAVEMAVRLNKVPPAVMTAALRKWTPKDLMAQGTVRAVQQEMKVSAAIYQLLVGQKAWAA